MRMKAGRHLPAAAALYLFRLPVNLPVGINVFSPSMCWACLVLTAVLK